MFDDPGYCSIFSRRPVISLACEEELARVAGTRTDGRVKRSDRERIMNRNVITPIIITRAVIAAAAAVEPIPRSWPSSVWRIIFFP